MKPPPEEAAKALKWIRSTREKEALAKSDWIAQATAYCKEEHLAELLAEYAQIRIQSPEETS